MRHLPLFVAIVGLSLAAPAFAQSARATGTVRDTDGRPIKGATVRAVNREASPPEITSTTDDRGRWAMIGLRFGMWTFIVEAPGFTPLEAQAPVRVASSSPMTFTLARDPGPVPGALTPDVLRRVAAANALRDGGNYEEALAAYQAILDGNPKLTSLKLVTAAVYRKQAADAPDPAARRALLERAITAYTELLEADAGDDGARVELEATRTEMAAIAR
jgi:tetratricopeptide (TPR) repeat protein